MRNRIPCQRGTGTRLATALCRRPFSACNKENRRHLHTGNFQTNNGKTVTRRWVSLDCAISQVEKSNDCHCYQSVNLHDHSGGDWHFDTHFKICSYSTEKSNNCYSDQSVNNINTTIVGYFCTYFITDKDYFATKKKSKVSELRWSIPIMYNDLIHYRVIN